MRALAAVLSLSLSAAAQQPQELKDWRGIIHCHGLRSHDSKGTDAEIIKAAKAAEIDFIFMTDHPSEKSLTEALRGLHDGVLFFGGAETMNLLAADIREPLAGPSRAEAVAQARKQGGLAFAAHPEEWKEDEWAIDGLAGMEIYNLHADVKDEGLEGIAKLLAAANKDPETAVLAIFDPPKDFLARWDSIGKSKRFVGIAGNDAHQNVVVMGVQLDPYERIFRFVTTHILAPDLTEASIRSALAEGRVYVAFEVLGRCRGFRCGAERDEKRLEMGSEAKFEKGWTLRAEFPEACEWRVRKDGKIVRRGKGDLVDCDVDGAGVWRLEGKKRDGVGKLFPWVYGNPHYFR